MNQTSVFIVILIKSWNRIDPPDDQELTRHRLVSELQGNENPFITNPERLEKF